jgi:hypothetical protein
VTSRGPNGNKPTRGRPLRDLASDARRLVELFLQLVEQGVVPVDVSFDRSTVSFDRSTVSL